MYLTLNCKHSSDGRQGAWGDNLTIQAIADMLSVLSSDHPAASATPSNGNATCEVSVGLIKQCHYVGLDKMCDSSVEQTAQNALNETQLLQPGISTTDLPCFSKIF